MVTIPGCYIETLQAPQLYTDQQLDAASRIAHLLHRGKLVLTVKPERP